MPVKIKSDFNKILVIQTAYLGDVILATSLLETIHHARPTAKIHMLIRKGNEGVFEAHPFLDKLHIWDKSKSKYLNLFRMAKYLRQEKFDLVINLQRFGSSGFLAWRTGAPVRAGFAGNFFSRFCSHTMEHDMDSGLHETERNFLLASRADVDLKKMFGPRLYPSQANFAEANRIGRGEYFVMAPSSVWFTKALPEDKWVTLIRSKPTSARIFLIGSSNDTEKLNRIANLAGHKGVEVLAGQLTILESTALMAGAMRNYLNDSAPLHMASAVNARVTAFFCSTVPHFGFGPLSEDAVIAEVQNKLSCRPCGLHGKQVCPEKHFRCGSEISVDGL